MGHIMKITIFFGWIDTVIDNQASGGVAEPIARVADILQQLFLRDGFDGLILKGLWSIN